MKYNIDRTSDTGNLNKRKPCSKAYLSGYDEWQYPRWCIEINTIEELQELINEVGEIIVNKESIEIYDDYRE